MINVQICEEPKYGQHTFYYFIFDDGVIIRKRVTRRTGQSYFEYIISKRYREAIRDWLYIRYGDDYRKKEQIFYPIFRISNKACPNDKKQEGIEGLFLCSNLLKGVNLD